MGVVLACDVPRGSRGVVLEHASLRCGGVNATVPLLVRRGVVCVAPSDSFDRSRAEMEVTGTDCSGGENNGCCCCWT
jgi:hypothetical protein